MKRACSAVVLAVLASGSMLADQSGARDVRLVAAQRVRADAIDTLRPAALSENGRLIAFVSRHRESSQRSCCQNVYVLDRSTGLITQESISTDGPASRWGQSGSEPQRGRAGHSLRDHRVEPAVQADACRTAARRRSESPERRRCDHPKAHTGSGQTATPANPS